MKFGKSNKMLVATFRLVAAQQAYDRWVDTKIRAWTAAMWLAVAIGGGVAVLFGLNDDGSEQILTGLGFFLAGWASLTATWTDEGLEARIERLEGGGNPAPVGQSNDDDWLVKSAGVFLSVVNVLLFLVAVVTAVITLAALLYVLACKVF